MGKKYLNTKEGSIEQSVLDVWQEAADMHVEGMDGRTTEYRSHRSKLETNRIRRENKKKSVKIEQPETQNGSGEHAYEIGTDRYAEYVAKITPGQIEEEIAELNTLIEELDEGVLGNIAKAAGKTARKAVSDVAKAGVKAVKTKVTKAKVVKAFGKVKAGVKKAKEIGGKIKRAAKTGTAYQANEYDPMLEKLEIIESKLNEYYKIMEEVELDEGRMDGFLRLTFKSPADVKKAMKVSDTEFGYRHFIMDKARTRPELDIEGDSDDLQDLKDALKSAGIKFEIDLEEEVDLDEGTSNIVDTIKNLWIEAASSAVNPKDMEDLGDVGTAGEKTAKKMKRAKEPVPGQMTEGTKEEYQKFFNAAMKKFKIDSPADLKSDEEKKKFFDYVDKNYKGEKSEALLKSVEGHESWIDNKKVELAKEFKVSSMRQALEKVWSAGVEDQQKREEKKAKPKVEDHDDEDDEKKGDTMTGKKKATVDVNPHQSSR